MKKRKIAMAMAGVMALAFGSTAYAEEPVTLTVSITADNAEGNFTGLSLDVFREKVEEVSGGQLILDCYYSNTLYAQEDETAAVTAGDVFMTYSGSAWLTDQSPWVSMLASGFFFRDYDHMDHVLNGEIGQEMFQRIADEQGILPLGALYTGARSVSLNTDREVTCREDLADITLRMPSSDAWMFMGEALGANPTAISFSDLYLALQTGTADGQENPVTSLRLLSLDEVQKSVTLTGHVQDSVWPTVNLEQWNALSEEQQEWIMEGFEAAKEYIVNAYNENVQTEVEALQEEGITVYQPDMTDYAAEVQDYYLNSDYVNDWDMDLYEKIQAVE